MKATVKKFLIGASVLASVSAIASAPAQAITLSPSSIKFDTTNYRTYTGGSAGIFTNGDAASAITALTDSNETSNVELWSSNEKPTANVGFSGIFDSVKWGKVKASVSSVTAADWAVFGDKWLNGLLASNSEINAIWNGLSAFEQTAARSYLKSTGLPSSGDPNVGALTLDEAKGAIDIALLGHYDLKPRILANKYSTGNSIFDGFLFNAAKKIKGKISASEVAKLTIGNDTFYAYGFNPVLSGITASDDQESYTGIYHFDPALTLTPPPPTTAVPEPATIVGLLGVGSLMTLRRRRAAS